MFAKTVDKVPWRCPEAYFLPLAANISFASLWLAELSCDGVKVGLLFAPCRSRCGIVDMSTLARAERGSGAGGGRVRVREPRRGESWGAEGTGGEGGILFRGG